MKTTKIFTINIFGVGIILPVLTCDEIIAALSVLGTSIPTSEKLSHSFDILFSLSKNIKINSFNYSAD